MLLARWLRAITYRRKSARRSPPPVHPNPRLDDYPYAGTKTMQPLRDYEDKAMRTERDYQDKSA